MRARLARIFAEHGFYAFRFDNQGVGESDGEFRRPDIADPNTEEVVAASKWLAGQGFEQIVVVAYCFGGLSSLIAAPMIPGLEAIAVVNAPVWRDHGEMRVVNGSWRWWATNLKRVNWRKLRSAGGRARYRRLMTAKASSLVGLRTRSTRFASAVKNLIDRGIPLLMVYGDDDFRVDFELELDRGLREAFEKVGPTSRIVNVAERLEGHASFAAQNALIRELVPWVNGLRGSTPRTDVDGIRLNQWVV
jgi:pimeloyl-ACP methyl ester carboxylesterase